ncbi:MULTISPECIES: response regulator transcription factor [unclassified Microbacterium]|uniref:response regulator transcription factor n=1 Tax=unclassified Microbacterium TaxID=2609290 RepID=UPI00214BD6BC|nr:MULTISPECIES: response regulator transcription factor [unclassified Microbacterium]MCR2784950.1 response regulator transcription factor [Microbacterium sp. zg.B96]MDL5352317.1 response regulator transcription factor [Microbacterium sp. zg-YB36]WIM16489.1 response regulator transcription factor [Microbacterium sp. zg-B96]
MAHTASPRAVVIEDDTDVRHLLIEILTSAGFTVTAAENGIDGIAAVVAYDPVITTIDVDMPGIDGFEVTRRIRAQGSDAYVVLITALTDEADAVLGFGVGADDVVTKPFRPRELRARLLALLRRPRVSDPDAPRSDGSATSAASTTTHVSDAVRLDGLLLDRDTRTVVVDSNDIALTRTEFELLATILESGRRVRSKADLVLTLHDETYLDPSKVSEADERAIEAHMTNLRRKLGDSALQPRFIETVRGAGYRAVAPHPDEDAEDSEP